MAQEKWFIKAQFNAIESKIKSRLILVGSYVASKARVNAPFLTGTLQRSITYEVEEENNLVRVGTNVEYAPFVELGSIHNIPTWFLTHAYNESIPMIKKIFGKKVTK